MNSRRAGLLALFFLCIAPALFGLGKGEKDAAQETKIVRVTGIVRLVGSALFSELVITGSEHEWYVAGEERDKLNDLQHRTVTVEGVETVTELKFANGLPAGIRRELKNIKIINIQ